MLMHANIHSDGSVAMPAPRARAEMALSVAAPAPRPTPAGQLVRNERPLFSSTSPRHATAAMRKARPPSALDRGSVSVPAWPIGTRITARAPDLSASPRNASAPDMRPQLRRPLGVDEALFARRFAPAAGVHRLPMPTAAVQRTLHVSKAHRSTGDVSAKSRRAMDHPLWTMPLHAERPPRQPSRSPPASYERCVGPRPWASAASVASADSSRTAKPRPLAARVQSPGDPSPGRAPSAGEWMACTDGSGVNVYGVMDGGSA